MGRVALLLGLLVPEGARAATERGTQTATAGAPTVSASVDPGSPSQDGTFSLEWGTAEDTARVFEVELAAPPEPERFERWYLGPATESFVSGIPSGEARVRVRAKAPDASTWGPWSEPLVVPVQHHAMSKALTLLALGCAVFALVAGFVLVMAWRTRRDEVPA